MSHSYCARCLTSFEGDPERCGNLSCGAPRPEKGWTHLLGVGDLLDRHYQIIKALAVGGAGLTYLAREIDATGAAIEPDLAIKVLYTQRDSGPFLRRLSNEAQILQDLAHEHIVQCRGFVHRAGHPPYLVTHFEKGGCLTDHIERVGPLQPKVAAELLRQILLALDVAHQRGVIHRDLKPDNVLLAARVSADETPHVRVADFGIAKVYGGVGERLTRFGSFIGTPEYAAPEQFEGLAPTPAADIFAAGGLFHYLLTGRPAVQFQQRLDLEECYQELLRQLPPPVPSSWQNTPEGAVIGRIFENMMAKEPGDRWTIPQTLAHLAMLAGAKLSMPTFDEPSSPQKVPRPAHPKPSSPKPPATPTKPPVPQNLIPQTPPPASIAAAQARSPLLGIAGLGGVFAATGVVCVVAVIAAAMGFGWFTPPAPQVGEVHLQYQTAYSPPMGPLDKTPATTQQFQKLFPHVHKKCGLGEKATIDLTLTSGGEIAQATTPGPGPVRACLRAELVGNTLAANGAPHVARVSP